jgi:hypothetical protein
VGGYLFSFVRAGQLQLEGRQQAILSVSWLVATAVDLPITKKRRPELYCLSEAVKDHLTGLCQEEVP